MTSVRVLLSRALDLLLRRQRDARLSEEMQTHLDLLTDDYIVRQAGFEQKVFRK